MRDEVTPTSAWAIYVITYQHITSAQPAISGHQTLSGTAPEPTKPSRSLRGVSWELLSAPIQSTQRCYRCIAM